jgi:hypothetical protein
MPSRFCGVVRPVLCIGHPAMILRQS